MIANEMSEVLQMYMYQAATPELKGFKNTQMKMINALEELDNDIETLTQDSKEILKEQKSKPKMEFFDFKKENQHKCNKMLIYIY